MALLGLDLGRVRGLAFLWHGLRQLVAQQLGQHGRAQAAEMPAQLVGRLVAADLDFPARVDRARVERLLQRHQAHARGRVAGEDGPLDRRRAPPPRQQREMDVEHRHHVEHVGSDQLPERDHHAQPGAHFDDVVDAIGDRKAEVERSRLHRARHQRAAAAALAVGL